MYHYFELCKSGKKYVHGVILTNEENVDANVLCFNQKL